jgi:hypothetical protein
MSAATMRPLVAPRFAPLSSPARVLSVGAWAAIALALAPSATDAFVWWSGAGLALAALWPFARAWRRGLDPGDALWYFVLYFVLAMFLRGIGLLTFVDSPYLRGLGDARSPSYRLLVGWVFFYCTLGLAALNAAYHAPSPRRAAAAWLRRSAALRAPWRDSRIVPVGLLFLAIGGCGAFLRMHSLGGFASAAVDPMSAATVDALGHFWQIALTEFAVVGFHVLVIGCLLRGGRQLTLLWLGLGLGLSVPLYLISSSKALLIRVLFTPMLFRHFLRKPLRMGHVLGFFAGFALLFPLFYAYRALGIGGLDTARVYLETTDAPLLKVFNRAYDADSFMRVLHATGQGLVPLQWGRSLLDLFFFFVPRALWAAKPESFGLHFATLCMPDVDWGAMTYVSSSLAGELFLNFHVVGVVIGFLLLGWALRLAITVTRQGGPGATLLYGYFFLAAVHLVEGSIAAQIEFFLTSAIPALIALRLLVARGAVGMGPGRSA